METDESLMVRVARGDDDALARLISRWQAPLYGFLRQRSEPAFADDLYQETWIRVVRARKRFDPARRFSTWLFGIANNLCRDRGRRIAAEARRNAGAAEVAALAPAPSAEDATLRMDLRRRVAALPERLREVVTLRYLVELSERETADALGIPRGTVKSRLHAAIARLRENDAAEGDDD